MGSYVKHGCTKRNDPIVMGPRAKIIDKQRLSVALLLPTGLAPFGMWVSRPKI